MKNFKGHRNPYLSCPSCFIFAPRKKDKMFNKRIKIKELLAQEPAGQEVVVMGWVRTFRNNQFIALNDGSTNNNLQVVVELGKFEDEVLKRITTSASLKVTGIIEASLGKGQKMDLKATTIEILGDSDAEKYPLQPKKHSLEFLKRKLTCGFVPTPLVPYSVFVMHWHLPSINFLMRKVLFTCTLPLLLPVMRKVPVKCLK